jgi:hypothetical protein
VEQVMLLVGPRADRLGELWDGWSHLRPLLLEEAVPVAV